MDDRRRGVSFLFHEYGLNTMLRFLKESFLGFFAPIWHTLHAYWLYPNVRFGYDCIVARGCYFEGDNRIHRGVTLASCRIGRKTYVCSRSVIRAASIGRYCSIAEGVQIGLPLHHLETVSTFPSLEGCVLTNKTTVVGNDVWIGTNAIILGNGISIGDGAVVGAGAVVTKDVPPYAIVGGVPAKVLRYRFSEEERLNLLKIQWWNWSIEEITLRKSDFLDVQSFTRKFAYA